MKTSIKARYNIFNVIFYFELLSPQLEFNQINYDKVLYYIVFIYDNGPRPCSHTSPKVQIVYKLPKIRAKKYLISDAEAKLTTICIGTWTGYHLGVLDFELVSLNSI